VKPQGASEVTNAHDVDAIGKAVPYGVYDVEANSAFVTIGIDDDTAKLAVESIETWWNRMGARRYPDTKELFLVALCDLAFGVVLDCQSASKPSVRLRRYFQNYATHC
jgi:hypothetical protein